MIPSLAPVKLRATKDGSLNAFNGFLGITIWRGAPVFAAVLAQERYDFTLRWLFLLVVGTIVGVPLGWFVHPFAGVIGFLLSGLLTRLPAIDRWMEIRGHAIECAVAAKFYGKDLTSYERGEAGQMVAGYDGLFEQMGLIGVMAQLKRNRAFAGKWVDDHADLIRKDKERVK